MWPVTVAVIVLSVLHIILGVSSICVGMVSSVQADVWLAHCLSPIWSGACFTMTGILGFACAKRKSAYMIMCFTAFGIVSLVTAIVSIQLLRLGLVNHTTEGDTYRKEKLDVFILVALGAAGIECLLSVVSSFVSCRLAKEAKKELQKKQAELQEQMYAANRWDHISDYSVSPDGDGQSQEERLSDIAEHDLVAASGITGNLSYLDPVASGEIRGGLSDNPEHELVAGGGITGDMTYLGDAKNEGAHTTWGFLSMDANRHVGISSNLSTVGATQDCYYTRTSLDVLEACDHVGISRDLPALDTIVDCNYTGFSRDVNKACDRVGMSYPTLDTTEDCNYTEFSRDANDDHMEIFRDQPRGITSVTGDLISRHPSPLESTEAHESQSRMFSTLDDTESRCHDNMFGGLTALDDSVPRVKMSRAFQSLRDEKARLHTTTTKPGDITDTCVDGSLKDIESNEHIIDSETKASVSDLTKELCSKGKTREDKKHKIKLRKDKINDSQLSKRAEKYKKSSTKP